jgi:hypothetical protein
MNRVSANIAANAHDRFVWSPSAWEREHSKSGTGSGRPRSGERFAEASRYIPPGAGSSTRTVKFGWKPYPPFMAEGSGSRPRDVDGHEYVDYLLGLGPMILGHRHPAVTRAVASAVSEPGTCFGLPSDSHHNQPSCGAPTNVSPPHQRVGSRAVGNVRPG